MGAAASIRNVARRPDLDENGSRCLGRRRGPGCRVAETFAECSLERCARWSAEGVGPQRETTCAPVCPVRKGCALRAACCRVLLVCRRRGMCIRSRSLRRPRSMATACLGRRYRTQARKMRNKWQLRARSGYMRFITRCLGSTLSFGVVRVCAHVQVVSGTPEGADWRLLGRPCLGYGSDQAHIVLDGGRGSTLGRPPHRVLLEAPASAGKRGDIAGNQSLRGLLSGRSLCRCGVKVGQNGLTSVV